MILYEGPSLLDGSPIVVVATGLDGKSDNRKTGGMIQTWILRADVAPTEAVKDGRDEAICGRCPHRGDDAGGGRSCYVNVGQAPLAVYRKFARGGYPRGDDAAGWASGRNVRVGSYGDPAAVPYGTWEAVTARCAAWTGYTHQWHRCDQRLQRICMASVDSVEDHLDARARGWRTFRIRGAATADRLAGEAVCPASGEAGHKLTCEQCLVCSGTHGRGTGSVVLAVHGSAGVLRAYQQRFGGIPVVTEAA